MELRELRVTRLPGIGIPFAVAGRPGLNLVLGPNGSGKSSLCRAALGLLWPDPRQIGRIVAGTWTEDGVTWLAERAGGPTVVWQRDGRPSDPPPLAPSHHAGVYRLGVLDLLKPAADATDQELAAAIRRQLAGGVDLAAVRGDFEWTGKEGQRGHQSLAETRRKIGELVERQARLSADEQRLDELRAQQREAVAAAGRARALTIGRDLAAAMRALQTAGDALAAFPPAMARLNPDDGERLGALADARRLAGEELARLAADRTAAERDREETALPDGGPDDAALALLREELVETRELAGELRGAEEDLAAAAAKLEAARAQLAGVAEPAAGEPVTPEQAGHAVNRLRERDRERAVRDALDALLGREDLARETTAAGDTAALATARAAAGDWLAAAAPPTAWPLRLLPWLATAVLLTVGLALLPWRTGDWPGWLALGAGTALAPAWWLLRRRAAAGRARRRREARAVFAGTGIEEPAAWSREAVARRLRGLVAQEAAAAQSRLREQLRVSLQGERDRAASALGDDDPVRELDTAQVLQRTAAWHAASAEHAAAEKRRERLASGLEARLAGLHERLAPWWRGEDEVTAVTAAVSELERRRERHREASKRLESAAGRHTIAAERRKAAQTEIEALLDRLGLDEDGAAGTLADLLARLDDYRAAHRAVEQRTLQRDAFLRQAEEQPEELADLTRGALQWPAAELEAAIAEAEARAERAEALMQEIVRIETRVDDARGDEQLADARAAEERQWAELAAVRDTVRGNALARLLLDRAAARYQAATEPPLLHRTRELFARFTDGRYELTVDDTRDEARFLARDVISARGLALAELSDGTRAQLLLAARLAALPEHERGARPPLFLDESLTASDPVRFEAIGKALLDVTRRDGRQVFYLTCDPADVQAWQQLLEAEGVKPASVIDLAEIRGLAAAAAPRRLRPAPPPAVPEPAGDAAAYGEAIGAPPLDPARGLDAAHLFHLLRDDLALLHALLRRRIERHGQLAAYAETLRADGTLGEAAWRRLQARGRALTAFLDAFAIGRGPAIPAGAILHESGIDTSKLEEIEALAARLDGDAGKLVTALEAGEVKRLHQTKRDEIVDWLAAQGYLDRRPVLDREDVRRRTIRALRADLAEGDVEWTALDQLLDAWWTAAGGEVAGEASLQEPRHEETS